MSNNEWITLEELREGAVFETESGTLAIKTEYYYDTSSQPMCVLLESGEFAHFPEKHLTRVKEVNWPTAWNRRPDAPPPAGEGRPVVVCLCGSTRFWRTFQEASLKETLAGRIVLSIGAASGTDDDHFGNLPREEYDRVKQELDALHFRKIEMADEVLILNVGGYIGESTGRELAHARALGKRVRFWEEESAPPLPDATLNRLVSADASLDFGFDEAQAESVAERRQIERDHAAEEEALRQEIYLKSYLKNTTVAPFTPPIDPEPAFDLAGGLAASQARALRDNLRELIDMARECGAEGVWVVREVAVAFATFVFDSPSRRAFFPGVTESLDLVKDRGDNPGLLVVLRFAASDGGAAGVEVIE
jgi:hypothetical protein